MIRAFAMTLLIMFIFAGDSGLAQEQPEPEQALKDQQLEATARKIMYEIRCVTCAGEPIAESQAELALAMRKKVREKIGEGYSPDDVRAWFVRRYGEQILFTPPVKVSTSILWAAPLLFLLLGALLLFLNFRKKKEMP